MEKVLFTVLCVLLSLLAFSNDSNVMLSDSAQPKQVNSDQNEPEESKNAKFSFSGYADSYYSGNFNKPLSRLNSGKNQVARVFDQKSGQMMLGMVQVVGKYTNKRSEVVFDLAFGPNADYGDYGNLLSVLSTGNEKYTSTALAIKQAYFTFYITDKLYATIGQFGTHIGYEVIESPVNFNYSLSNLFGQGPFYHTGLKATYIFSERSSLMLGVVNKVDGFGDNNRKKGLISQFFISPAKDWSVYLNFIHTNDADIDSVTYTQPAAYYRLCDLSTSYRVSDRLLIGLNMAMGSEKLPNADHGRVWGGAAGYLNWAFTSMLGLGFRYEYFDNASGIRSLRDFEGNGTAVNALTVTGNITIADGHILVKPEFRFDSYSKRGLSEREQFEDARGGFTHNTQSTLGVAFIYKF